MSQGIAQGEGDARGRSLQRLTLFASSHVQPNTAVDELGKAYYSYGFAMDGHLKALRMLGQVPQFVTNPRAVKDRAWAQEFLGKTATVPVHLMFKNFRSIRPLDWTYNIGVLAWEFATLTSAEADIGNVFRNQRRMLGLCDEIWVAASFARAVMRKAGFDNTYVVPSAVEVAARGDRTALMEREAIAPVAGFVKDDDRNTQAPLGLHPSFRAVAGGGKVYLSVLNPLDARKDLPTLLHGFAAFAKLADQPVVLLVKLSVRADRSNLSDIVAASALPVTYQSDLRGFASDKVLLLSGSFSAAEMRALYDLADFYVSPTRAEGQNLPVIEAMMTGVPPISPYHTAMSDYLDTGNSLAIATSERSVPRALRMNYHQAAVMHWHELNPRAVCEALGSSLRLSKNDYRRLGEAARRDATRLFSVETVSKYMEERLVSICQAQGRG